MILSLLLAALAFIVLAAILRPLRASKPDALPQASAEVAVYRDQLRELDRDIARGLLSEAEARATRVEIQRRLLAAADRTPELPPPPAAAARRSRALPLLIAGFVALGSVGLYGVLSEPQRLTDGATAQRAELEAMSTRLRERLDADPANLDSWRLYARSLAMLGRWDAAIEAYARAITLGDTSTGTLAAQAEVMVARAGGTVVPAARDAFRAILAREPDSGVARYYLALAAGQDGDPRGAIAQLQALAADLPADAPVRAEIARRIAEFAAQAGIPVPPLAAGRAPAPPGPDQASMDAAAALPEAERAAMIRAMVERLAERLQREPDDAEGWLRLARSWQVLNAPDKAADAYERAAALRPTDVSILLSAVEALLAGRGATDPLPPRAVAILRRIEAIRPEEPAVLWYLGLAAAQEGRRDVALGYWRRLRDLLPAGHPDAPMVRSAIAALGDD